MLVDPNTGMPLESPMSQTIGSTVAGAYGMTPEDHATLFSILENIPTAKQTAGWNAWRATRTMMKGPLGEGRFTNKFGHGGIANHLNPRSWGRFTSYDVITGANSTYSPFNFMSWAGNLGANKAQGTSGVQYFSRGTYATMSGAMRMANSPTPSRMSNALRFVESQSPGMADRAFRQSYGTFNPFAAGAGKDFLDARATYLSDGRNVAGLMSQLPTGKYSGKVSGYFAASRGLLTEGTVDASRPFVREGVIAATKHLTDGGITNASGKIGLRVGASAIKQGGPRTAMALGVRGLGMAIPGVNMVMTAWMLADIVKMGAAAMRGTVEFAKDAGVSMRGSINKPVMGMGFRDNTVAATSRARGVMAIQNSQLNARSALGSEGAMMSAHFG